jgi:endonuclease/exonuclease/phosphatase (EEP) superfamily protein YafD
MSDSKFNPKNFKQIREIGLILAIASCTLFSLAGYFGRWHLFLELTSHFRLQYLIFSMGIMGLFLWLARLSKIGLAICAFCLVINLAEILPWYLPVADNNPTISAQNLRVLSANVLRSNKEHDRVISLVREEQPDLALFMEVNDTWSDTLLAQLKDILPYALSYPLDNYHGIALYSKFPLENGVFQEFGVKGIISIVAEVTVGVEKLKVIGTHTFPPTGFRLEKGRNKQLAEISGYLQTITTPKIVFGDLNITMWSPYYKDFVATTGMRNARAGFGVQPTWYKKLPIFYIPIDHCLVSPDISVQNSRVGDRVGSDHLPIIVDLAIPQKSDRAVF